MIKNGDTVKARDLSFSMYILPDGTLGSYNEVHDSFVTDSPFNLKTMYRVIATGVKGLPSYSAINKVPYHIPNDTIIQDVQNKEIIFIQIGFLYPVCSVCGTKHES